MKNNGFGLALQVLFSFWYISQLLFFGGGEGGVLIFSGKTERSGSSSVEFLGSNPLHRYDCFISLFSLSPQVVGHSLLNSR